MEQQPRLRSTGATEPKEANVAQDLAALFADTAPDVRLEALRIATAPQRLMAWAAIVAALGGVAAVVRALFWARSYLGF